MDEPATETVLREDDKDGKGQAEASPPGDEDKNEKEDGASSG